MMTKVVNMRTDREEIADAVKEGNYVRIDRKTKWGNPFRIGVDGTREEVIQKYADWVSTNVELLVDLEELRGKCLGCWCVREPVTRAGDRKQCHGEVLLQLLT